jgi:hypothetical protein
MVWWDKIGLKLSHQLSMNKLYKTHDIVEIFGCTTHHLIFEKDSPLFVFSGDGR